MAVESVSTLCFPFCSCKILNCHGSVAATVCVEEARHDCERFETRQMTDPCRITDAPHPQRVKCVPPVDKLEGRFRFNSLRVRYRSRSGGILAGVSGFGFDQFLTNPGLVILMTCRAWPRVEISGSDIDYQYFLMGLRLEPANKLKPKAAEDCRSPRRFARFQGVGRCASFWTAAVLWRFASGVNTPAMFWNPTHRMCVSHTW